MTAHPAILPYEFRPAGYFPYDPRALQVAALVKALIEAAEPGVEVEHIGSTAIPGCDGKGVVDLMMLYQPGGSGLEESRATLEQLGFERFSTPEAHPITRPVYLGAIEHDGTLFRLHVHVLAADADEVARQRHFRDTLRADRSLVEAYMANKRAILARGITHGPAYADEKDAFIASVHDLGLRPQATQRRVSDAPTQPRRGVVE